MKDKTSSAGQGGKMARSDGQIRTLFISPDENFLELIFYLRGLEEYEEYYKASFFDYTGSIERGKEIILKEMEEAEIPFSLILIDPFSLNSEPFDDLEGALKFSQWIKKNYPHVEIWGITVNEKKVIPSNFSLQTAGITNFFLINSKKTLDNFYKNFTKFKFSARS